MKPLTFCLLLLCGTAFYAEAQINPGRIIERAAARQLEREIDREVRESANERTERRAEERSEEEGDNAPAATYTFNADAKIKVQFFETRRRGEKAEDPVRYRYFFPESGAYLGMKPLGEGTESMDMVIMEDQKTHSFVSQDGTKMRMSMNFKRYIEKQNKNSMDEEETENYSVRRTGKTKTILGYSCDEYIMENEDKTHRTTVWLAPVLEEQMEKMPMVFMSMGGYMTNNLDGNKGMVLEMEMVDEEEKQRMTFQVEELNVNKTTTFNTSGYRAMGLGLFGN